MTIRYGGVIAGEEEIEAVTAVLRSQNWASGQLTEEFEQAAADWQECRYALFCNSGSSALLLSLCNLPAGTRIMMPSTQFATLYGAARWCGLQPVLVDCDDTLNMSPAALEKALQAPDLPSAVAFVHMAGNPANIGEIAGICEDRRIELIEDCCEAFGAVSGDVRAGNFGRAAAVSTHAAHHISTGEGGLVFTSDTSWYRKMRRVRDWGRTLGDGDLRGYYGGYSFGECGLNLHATDIQAALGLVQLKRLEDFIQARRNRHMFLAIALRGLPLELPRVNEGDLPSWYTFPVLTPRRDELMDHLLRRDIECRPVVAGDMSRQPVTGGRYSPADFPGSGRIFREGMWVSVHPMLEMTDLEVLARGFRSFFDA